MQITSIDLLDFRNYKTLSMTPSDKINILYGANAQGKTNLLEAIYTGCTSRSHKSVKDKELIRFGCEESHIKLGVARAERNCRIDIHIKKAKAKGIAVNGILLKRASDLLGTVNIVMFSPEDLALIKNGPSERRRFLDIEMCQLDRIYMHDLIAYHKVLEEKNALLKAMFEKKTEDSTMLSVYNEQLIEYGIKIIKKREAFIRELGGIIKEKHAALTDGREELTVSYEKNVSEQDFHNTLLLQEEREIKNGTSLFGPHRDDLCFKINGIDIRHYGSQGQQRSAALSLKMAEIEIIKKIAGESPVLLLDDVLSELDTNRQTKLLDSLRDIQVFITSTGIDDLVSRRFPMDRIYFVEEGTVRLVKDRS